MSLASRIKENPKVFYTFIKNKRANREMAGPVKDKRGNLHGVRSKVLNKYFISTFIKEKDTEDSESTWGILIC